MQENALNTKRFTIATSGWYALHINASCQKGSDARIVLDGETFRELPALKNVQKYNIPASWNGTNLLGEKQTNIFIKYFESGQHEFEFIARGNAKLINWKTSSIGNIDKFTLNLNSQANKSERQPLVNLILIGLPLASISAKIGLKWHKRSVFRGDGDDVKLVINGQLQQRDVKKQWLWSAQKTFKEEIIQEKEIVTDLSNGLHYLEFWADQSPKLYSITICTKPYFEGDFWCRPELRRPYGKDKAVLGVYLESGDPKEINNHNIRAYFDGELLKLGKVKGFTWVDEQIRGLFVDMFDFDTHIFQDENTNWFYYGVDSSWKLKHPDWRDASKWKIIKT